MNPTHVHELGSFSIRPADQVLLEQDLNPVRVLRPREGAVVVDARIRVGSC